MELSWLNLQKYPRKNSAPMIYLQVPLRPLIILTILVLQRSANGQLEKYVNEAILDQVSEKTGSRSQLNSLQV